MLQIHLQTQFQFLMMMEIFNLILVPRGSDDDEFENPSGMVIDETENVLYVADTDNNRIQMFQLTDGSNCPSGTDEIENR